MEELVCPFPPQLLFSMGGALSVGVQGGDSCARSQGSSREADVNYRGQCVVFSYSKWVNP